MLLIRLTMLLSFSLFSLAGFANEMLAQRILSTYLHGLEGGMARMLATAENGVSINQLSHLNKTILRTAVRDSLPGARSVLQNLNTTQQIKVLDDSVFRAQQLLENYRNHVADSRIIGFKNTSAQAADMVKVQKIVRQINESRFAMNMDPIARDLLDGPPMDVIIRINRGNNLAAKGSARLAAHLGGGTAEKLLKTSLKAF